LKHLKKKENFIVSKRNEFLMAALSLQTKVVLHNT